MATLGVHFNRATGPKAEPLPQDVQGTLRAAQRVDQKIRSTMQSIEASDPQKQKKMLSSVQSNFSELEKHLNFLHTSKEAGNMDQASDIKATHFQRSYDSMFEVFEALKHQHPNSPLFNDPGEGGEEGGEEMGVSEAESDRDLLMDSRQHLERVDYHADVIIDQMMSTKETLEDQRKTLEEAHRNTEALGSEHMDQISALIQAIRAKKKNDFYILAILISFFSFLTIVYWLSRTSARD